MDNNKEVLKFLESQTIQKNTEEFTTKDEIIQLLSFFYLNSNGSLFELLQFISNGECNKRDIPDNELLLMFNNTFKKSENYE